MTTTTQPQTKPRTHTLELGSILISMWGYDQTNVDYFEVVAVTPTMVTVSQLRTRRVSTPAYLTSVVEPIPGDHIGVPLRRKVHHYSRPSIAIESFANAYLWDGKPQTATHYA